MSYNGLHLAMFISPVSRISFTLASIFLLKLRIDLPYMVNFLETLQYKLKKRQYMCETYFVHMIQNKNVFLAEDLFENPNTEI